MRRSQIFTFSFVLILPALILARVIPSQNEANHKEFDDLTRHMTGNRQTGERRAREATSSKYNSEKSTDLEAHNNDDLQIKVFSVLGKPVDNENRQTTNKVASTTVASTEDPDADILDEVDDLATGINLFDSVVLSSTEPSSYSSTSQSETTGNVTEKTPEANPTRHYDTNENSSSSSYSTPTVQYDTPSYISASISTKDASLSKTGTITTPPGTPQSSSSAGNVESATISPTYTGSNDMPEELSTITQEPSKTPVTDDSTNVKSSPTSTYSATTDDKASPASSGHSSTTLPQKLLGGESQSVVTESVESASTTPFAIRDVLAQLTTPKSRPSIEDKIINPKRHKIDPKSLASFQRSFFGIMHYVASLIASFQQIVHCTVGRDEQSSRQKRESGPRRGVAVRVAHNLNDIIITLPQDEDELKQIGIAIPARFMERKVESKSCNGDQSEIKDRFVGIVQITLMRISSLLHNVQDYLVNPEKELFALPVTDSANYHFEQTKILIAKGSSLLVQLDPQVNKIILKPGTISMTLDSNSVPAEFNVMSQTTLSALADLQNSFKKSVKFIIERNNHIQPVTPLFEESSPVIFRDESTPSATTVTTSEKSSTTEPVHPTRNYTSSFLTSEDEDVPSTIATSTSSTSSETSLTTEPVHPTKNDTSTSRDEDVPSTTATFTSSTSSEASSTTEPTRPSRNDTSSFLTFKEEDAPSTTVTPTSSTSSEESLTTEPVHPTRNYTSSFLTSKDKEVPSTTATFTSSTSSEVSSTTEPVRPTKNDTSSFLTSKDEDVPSTTATSASSTSAETSLATESVHINRNDASSFLTFNDEEVPSTTATFTSSTSSEVSSTTEPVRSTKNDISSFLTSKDEDESIASTSTSSTSPETSSITEPVHPIRDETSSFPISSEKPNFSLQNKNPDSLLNGKIDDLLIDVDKSEDIVQVIPFTIVEDSKEPTVMKETMSSKRPIQTAQLQVTNTKSSLIETIETVLNKIKEDKFHSSEDIQKLISVLKTSTQENGDETIKDPEIVDNDENKNYMKLPQSVALGNSEKQTPTAFNIEESFMKEPTSSEIFPQVAQLQNKDAGNPPSEAIETFQSKIEKGELYTSEDIRKPMPAVQTLQQENEDGTAQDLDFFDDGQITDSVDLSQSGFFDNPQEQQTPMNSQGQQNPIVFDDAIYMKEPASSENAPQATYLQDIDVGSPLRETIEVFQSKIEKGEPFTSEDIRKLMSAVQTLQQEDEDGTAQDLDIFDDGQITDSVNLSQSGFFDKPQEQQTPMDSQGQQNPIVLDDAVYMKEPASSENAPQVIYLQDMDAGNPIRETIEAFQNKIEKGEPYTSEDIRKLMSAVQTLQQENEDETAQDLQIFDDGQITDSVNLSQSGFFDNPQEQQTPTNFDNEVSMGESTSFESSPQVIQLQDLDAGSPLREAIEAIRNKKKGEALTSEDINNLLKAVQSIQQMNLANNIGSPQVANREESPSPGSSMKTEVSTNAQFFSLANSRIAAQLEKYANNYKSQVEDQNLPADVKASMVEDIEEYKQELLNDEIENIEGEIAGGNIGPSTTHNKGTFAYFMTSGPLKEMRPLNVLNLGNQGILSRRDVPESNPLQQTFQDTASSNNRPQVGQIFGPFQPNSGLQQVLAPSQPPVPVQIIDLRRSRSRVRRSPLSS